MTRDKQSALQAGQTHPGETVGGGWGRAGAPQQFQVSSLGEMIPPALVHMPNQASGLVGAASQGTRGGCMWCWSSPEKQGEVQQFRPEQRLFQCGEVRKPA